MNIEEYKNAVVSTLEHWLAIHTNPEAWAAEWIMDDDIIFTFTDSKGELSNNYFSFDWAASALKLWVKDNRHSFMVCSHGIQERGFEECSHIGHTPSIAALTEYFSDYYDYESVANLVSEYTLLHALETDGFKAYRKALKPVTASVEAEIADVLQQIADASDDDELMAALTWANHVNHVNENIARDYGDRFGLDYELVDSISQEGIANVLEMEY